MIAVEALRKAQTTVEHCAGGETHSGRGWKNCAFATECIDTSETDEGDAQKTCEYHASLLLDGFSVRELTRAERKLER